jgi:uncharacterized protein
MHTQNDAYTPGRRFLVPLPAGKDLIAALETICSRNAVQTAAFTIIGAASLLTIGTYDQQQQVFVTHRKEGFFEIVSCTGNISRDDQGWQINGRMMAADLDGRVWGGTLFSQTQLYTGELDLQELLGAPLSRTYDPATGLLAWPNTRC